MTEGLRVLLDASLLAGAGHRHSSYRLLLASQTVPDGRLGAFWRRLGVLQDDLAPDPLKYLAEIERKLRVEIPARIKLLAPFLAQGEYHRFMEWSHTRVLTAMKNAGRLDVTIKKGDLVRIGEGYSTRQHTPSRPDAPAFGFWSQSIPDLIRASHDALTQSRGEDHAIDECDLDSLLILGASCVALRTVQECKWCYRWSLPGLALCADHTLSVHAGVDPRIRQRQYRRGQWSQQDSHKGIGDASSDNRSARKIPLLRPAHLGEDLRLYVGRVLWRATSPEEQEIAVRMVRALREPHIAAVLGFEVEALTTSGVDDFLRQRLEPGQWLPVHWEWKVWKAVLLGIERHRKILAAEAASTQRLEARLDAALQVAAEYRCNTLTEVAAHLNVRRATVSQWLRKSSSLKVAQLRTLIAANHFRRPQRRSID